MSCAIKNTSNLQSELIKVHKQKQGFEQEKAEEDFILLAQSLPHYGGHFYTASWVIILGFLYAFVNKYNDLPFKVYPQKFYCVINFL